MSAMNGVVLKNMVYNGMSVKKWNHNGVQVFSAGSTVTYFIDAEADTPYRVEEVDNGESCLSFTPTKTGWKFIGWRKDTAASGSVESSVIMGTDPIVLYAVFEQEITLTYYMDGTPTPIPKKAYYNGCGAYAWPTFTLANPTLPGATFNGWSITAGSAAITYGSLANGIQITTNTTVYAVFTYANGTADQTLTYNGSADYYDDTPKSITLTLPSTASSMVVTAYQPNRNFADGGQENIWIGGTAIPSDGQWYSVGTYTESTTLSVIFGYCVPNVTLTFRKTYTGKTIVG